YPALRGNPEDVPAGVALKQIWSEAGFRTSAQKVLGHLAHRLTGGLPSAEGVEGLLRVLAEDSFLVEAQLYGYRIYEKLSQFNDACLQLYLATEARRQRCRVCPLVVPDAPAKAPCPRCSGELATFTDADVRRSRYAARALNRSAEPLDAREHTAQ